MLCVSVRIPEKILQGKTYLAISPFNQQQSKVNFLQQSEKKKKEKKNRPHFLSLHHSSCNLALASLSSLKTEPCFDIHLWTKGSSNILYGFYNPFTERI